MCAWPVSRESGRCPPRWRTRRRQRSSELPTALRPWLWEEDSLTRRLRNECGSPFTLQLISQRWARPLPDEVRALRLRAGTAALVRQVRLLCGERAVVFARSVIPVPILKGASRRLAHLGTRPLAHILFADRSVRRGEMEFALLTPETALFGLARRALGSKREGFWARRSLFHIARKRLLVSEVFLPDIADGRR